METTKTSIKSLKPGRYVNIDGEPCRVLSIQISKPGKHGSAKARVETQGIFDNQKRIILKPADEEMEVPLIEKKTAQIIAIIDEDRVQLMDTQSYETFESKVPEELKGKIQQGGEVTYWKFGHRMMLTAARDSVEE
jgi:translation initiation factor 5A